MPSRADARRAVEWALRVAAIGLLAWALVASASRRPAAGDMRTATLDASSADGRLAAWTRDPDLARLHLRLEQAPDARRRAWLRALAAAGTAVGWMGAIPAIGLEAESVADPRGGVDLRIAGPAGERVRLRDGVGSIDSIGLEGAGGSLRVRSLSGEPVARLGGATARVLPPPPRTLRTVVVIGAAGWESKFVVAALEERGWTVAARFRVAPGLTVGGAIPPLDTTRVGAVVALDSTADAEAAAIVRYLRSGGGVILGPGAARLRAFAQVVAARTGPTRPAATSYAAAIAPVTRQTLAAAPLVSLRPDAVPLESRATDILVAARRVAAGRLVQSGFEESWRWRMAGGPDGPEAHRLWWSGLVSAVAYAPATEDSAIAGAGGGPPEPAPRAALVAALGPPTLAPDAATRGGDSDPSRSLAVYIAAALLLLAEWASRRLRGAR